MSYYDRNMLVHCLFDLKMLYNELVNSFVHLYILYISFVDSYCVKYPLIIFLIFDYFILFILLKLHVYYIQAFIIRSITICRIIRFRRHLHAHTLHKDNAYTINHVHEFSGCG